MLIFHKRVTLFSLDCWHTHTEINPILYLYIIYNYINKNVIPIWHLVRRRLFTGEGMALFACLLFSILNSNFSWHFCFSTSIDSTIRVKFESTTYLPTTGIHRELERLYKTHASTVLQKKKEAKNHQGQKNSCKTPQTQRNQIYSLQLFFLHKTDCKIFWFIFCLILLYVHRGNHNFFFNFSKCACQVCVSLSVSRSLLSISNVTTLFYDQCDRVWTFVAKTKKISRFINERSPCKRKNSFSFSITAATI